MYLLYDGVELHIIYLRMAQFYKLRALHYFCFEELFFCTPCWLHYHILTPILHKRFFPICQKKKSSLISWHEIPWHSWPISTEDTQQFSGSLKACQFLRPHWLAVVMLCFRCWIEHFPWFSDKFQMKTWFLFLWLVGFWDTLPKIIFLVLYFSYLSGW